MFVLGAAVIAPLLSISREKRPVAEYGIEYLATCRIVTAFVNLPNGRQIMVDSPEELTCFRDMISSLVPFQSEKIDEDDVTPEWMYQLGLSGSGHSPTTIDISVSETSGVVFYLSDGGFYYRNGNADIFRNLIEQLKLMQDKP